MSELNCSACSELREHASDFIVNGVTDNVCASLKNNTGFNPSDANDDCEDLDLANDCLIGNMAEEIDAYDVCDWKEYMKKFVPNVWTMFKALICAICGIWENITELWSFSKDICEKVDQIVTPSARGYGVFPYTGSYPQYTNYVNIGTINSKNGSPLMEVYDRSEIVTNRLGVSGVGVYYSKKELSRCSDGKCQIYEWFEPYFYDVRFTADVAIGDILWYCDKATFMEATGCTERLWWNLLKNTESHPGGGGWLWTDMNMGTDHRFAWVQMIVDYERMGDNYITLVYRGSSYPDGAPGRQSVGSPQGLSFKTLASNC